MEMFDLNLAEFFSKIFYLEDSARTNLIGLFY